MVIITFSSVVSPLPMVSSSIPISAVVFSYLMMHRLMVPSFLIMMSSAFMVSFSVMSRL
jgi:hypothetical protein